MTEIKQRKHSNGELEVADELRMLVTAYDRGCAPKTAQVAKMLRRLADQLNELKPVWEDSADE